jgi:hypothetical protein
MFKLDNFNYKASCIDINQFNYKHVDYISTDLVQKEQAEP